MSTHRHIDFICIAVFVCALVLTVLFMNGERLGIEKLVDEDAERNSGSEYFTSNDLSADYDLSGATVITLTGESATVSGNGAYVNGSDVVITNAGVYSLSGTLTDGSIIVDAYRSSKVFLYFDGVSVTASDDAALRVDQADKVFVTLAPGSENSLASGEVYSDAALADGTDGAIFAHDDLTINGSGTLSVTSGYRHGIAANDELVITGGRVTVSAPADAIHANDALRITNCALSVEAGDDGLVVDEETGLFYLESGFVSVSASDDAVHSNGDIEIVGGDLSISAGDDGIHADGGVTISGGTILITECYEGIEGLTIDVSGGDITIYPSDDGFNASGGSASGFGFPGGFGGGMMGGQGGFGGREGWNPSENTDESADAGTSRTGESTGTAAATGETASAAPETKEADSTQNASDAAQQTRPFGTQAAMPVSASDGTSEAESVDPCIRISGGTITILNASGRDADGLDSNGSIYITGGDIRVSLTGSGGNNAIDYGSESGGVCVISGGTVIACGSSSMTEAFDESSEQPAILWNFSTVTEDGSVFTLTDESGAVLTSWEVPYGCSSINVSCPELEIGETYTLTYGSESVSVTPDSVSATAGTASGFGMMGGGFGGGMMGGRGGQAQSGTESENSESAGSFGFFPDPGSTDTSGSASGFPGGGRGRRGGQGGFPGQSGSEDAGAGTDGSFPTPPDFAEGEMPAPPELAAGETPPDFENGEAPTPPGFAEGEQSAAAEDETAEAVTLSHGSALSELDTRTWPMLALCTLVLLAGLAVAVAYRRRR